MNQPMIAVEVTPAPIAARRARCKVEAGEILPCANLQGLLADQDAQHAIACNQAFNSTTKRVQVSAVGIRSGKQASVRWVMKYCPFCRADIGTHLVS